MMRAGELTANARAANIASSGLVAQFGTAEFNAMDGGNKGKQTVSTAGMCCLGLWVLVPCFYFTWIWSYGVTFKYYGSGDLSNLWHENATIDQGAEYMYNLYPKNKKVDGNEVFDCDGLGASELKLDTGLKRTGTLWSSSGSGGISFPYCGTATSGPSGADAGLNIECTVSGATCVRSADCVTFDAVNGQACLCNLCNSFTDCSIVGTMSFTGPSSTTRRLDAAPAPLPENVKQSVPRRQMSAISYSTSVIGPESAIVFGEFQKCKGIHKDFGAEWFMNENDDGPVFMVAYHTIRQQAKFSGAFYWATAIAAFFSIGRGASFAARSVSGLSLGFAVVGALYILQSCIRWFAPDYTKVPQYFRDDETIALLVGLLFGGIAFALNLVGFIVGIGKTKEVEGAAPAAAPAAMDEPTPEASMPPQAEADAEAPMESAKEAPAAEA